MQKPRKENFMSLSKKELARAVAGKQ